jgi:hypothetical protein
LEGEWIGWGLGANVFVIVNLAGKMGEEGRRRWNFWVEKKIKTKMREAFSAPEGIKMEVEKGKRKLPGRKIVGERVFCGRKWTFKGRWRMLFWCGGGVRCVAKWGRLVGLARGRPHPSSQMAFVAAGDIGAAEFGGRMNWWRRKGWMALKCHKNKLWAREKESWKQTTMDNGQKKMNKMGLTLESELIFGRRK